MISAVVAFWFFISIFISNGTWSRFIATVIVAFVSKRLLRFFIKLRRAFYSTSVSVEDTEVESLVQELRKLPPHERKLWADHLEALASVKGATQLHEKIKERAPSLLGLWKGWLNLELVSETFKALQASGMDMDAVARLNRVVMTQAELMQDLIVQWRKLNPEAEDNLIDALKRGCDVVLTSTGYTMKILIARRRRELNPKAVLSLEDVEILETWDRISLECETQPSA
jgi:phosphoserine phosphatase